MGRKRAVILLAVLISVAAVALLSVYEFYQANKRKAVRLAEEYLAQKYEQQMVYKGVRHAWIDPEQYHVTFTSAETEVTFQVSMWPHVLKRTSAEGTDDIWDNYLWSFFCKETEAVLQPEAASIWNGFDHLLIGHSPTKNKNAALIAEINEHTSAREMEYAYNYDLYVTPGCVISSESEREEAQNILKLFQMLRDRNYRPSQILVWYQPSNPSGPDGEEAKKAITFESWETIDTVDQIIEIMREELPVLQS